jgi:hypothetical protein
VGIVLLSPRRLLAATEMGKTAFAAWCKAKKRYRPRDRERTRYGWRAATGNRCDPITANQLRARNMNL